MVSLSVDLGDRSYAIEICQDFSELSSLFSAAVASNQLMIVSNDVIAPLYLEHVQSNLPDRQIAHCILKDGEQYKDLQAVETIVTKLLEAKFDRGCTLVALGGGVVGDITGFAAASYQRGVKFVQIPTTLLAQVDSSVGGKTGVNHPLGKNMIGAFHQPQLVFANVATLHSLPDRELRAGIAEVIKYGLIASADFLSWLENNIEKLLARDALALTEAIKVSCETKAKIVAQDERESGIRAILNLGHTFGHAIETGLGYGEWLHGEAVGCGMCLAATMSNLAGWVSSEDVERTHRLIERAGLPTSLPQTLSRAELLAHMQVDKKNRDGKIRLVLLEKLGQAIVTDDFDPNLLSRVLEH
ncbi:MAG: 3-dehydroquinate synthase [Gammaproteobacteria bacterium]